MLLNNDTIVPSGWLTRLLRHLEDPRVGLVGPTTNFVGNEAKVEAPYQTILQMEQYAHERARRFADQISEIDMLAMFCVAFRRDTYRTVGPLDERFGIGMFEDDDYSVRIKKAGLEVVCALDSFVHHFGQSSFVRLIDDGTYNPLFDRNRALCTKRNGMSPGKRTCMLRSPHAIIFRRGNVRSRKLPESLLILLVRKDQRRVF